MVRRSLKIVSLAALVVLAAGAIAIAVTLWRLNQGPVSLAFAKDTVEATINDALPGTHVSIGNVILERDRKTGRPRLRMQDLVLTDEAGQLIAQAPRASITISTTELLTGTVVPRELELIGARILARRTASGGFELGFGGSQDTSMEPARQSVASGKTDRSDLGPTVSSPFDDGRIANVMDVLNRELLSGDKGPMLSRLEAIKVSQATVSLFDSTNGAVWYSPEANLVFQRVPYGYAVFADAQVATRHAPWRTELVANYRRADKSFNISARIFNLIPANIADNVFALSQFAEIDLPLSGHVEFTVDSAGKLKSGSAELSTAAGKVRFPGYIADPIVVDEGLLRFDYDPVAGDLVIGNSAIFVGGSQAQLSGRLHPQRDANQRITAVGMTLDARDVAIDTDGDVRDSVAFDRITFKGVASVVDARLDVDDLVLQSGKSGVRLRGSFVGGEQAVGVYISGLMRDISSHMLMELWPPVVAQGTRNWIDENVKTGRISDGEFQLAIPPKVLADALNDVPMPESVAKVKFRLDDVTATYLENQPPITGGSGTGELTGNVFTLKVEKGLVKVHDGDEVDVAGSSLISRDLAAAVSPAVIEVKASGHARTFAELADRKPFELLRQANISPTAISGTADLKVIVQLPFRKDFNPDDISVTASAQVHNAGLKGAAEGVDLANGDVSVSVSQDKVEAQGPVEINGLPAKMSWTRVLGADNGVDTLAIASTLDDAQRLKLGIDLAPYVRGPIRFSANSKSPNGKFARFDIDADLSDATIAVPEIDWSRPPVAKTRASLTVDLSGGATSVSNLKLAGTGFHLEGDLKLNKQGGLASADFSRIELGPDNVFKAKVATQDNGYQLTVSGRVFDARPLMSDLFSGAEGGQGGASGPPVLINMALDRLIAFRGEVLNDVTGSLSSSAGTLQYADIRGNFSNGSPIAVEIRPRDTGARHLQVTGRDAGAALRAANLYSKIGGGLLDFSADLAQPGRGTIEKGRLVIRNFEVRNEARLSDIDQPIAAQQNDATGRGVARSNGPRSEGRLAFSSLSVPFSVDNNFVRIGDALIRGPEIGASANGIIRKKDGAMDIGGTIIPAYALNSAISEVPVFGQILTGGKGQGVFGLNFALKGTMSEPRFLVNPVSAIAPGFLRQMFQIGGGNVASDGTAAQPTQTRPQQGGANR